MTKILVFDDEPSILLMIKKMLGANAVFSKPLIPKEFLQAVSDLLSMKK